METRLQVLERQRVNVEAMLCYWQAVQPGAVDLRQYECGSCACVGGHAVRSGIFPGLVMEDLMPVMHADGKEFYGDFVASYLFGGSRLFGVRGEYDTDRLVKGSDYEVAKARLEDRLTRINASIEIERQQA